LVKGARVQDRQSKEETLEWKEHARVFLQNCYLESADQKKEYKLPKKIERLATFYLLHACDWQLQSMGLDGYALYFPVEVGPQLPIEKRPLLIENMDSSPQNLCKEFHQTPIEFKTRHFGKPSNELHERAASSMSTSRGNGYGNAQDTTNPPDQIKNMTSQSSGITYKTRKHGMLAYQANCCYSLQQDSVCKLLPTTTSGGLTMLTCI